MERERFFFWGKKEITEIMELPTYTTLYLSRTRKTGPGELGAGGRTEYRIIIREHDQ